MVIIIIVLLCLFLCCGVSFGAMFLFAAYSNEYSDYSSWEYDNTYEEQEKKNDQYNNIDFSHRTLFDDVGTWEFISDSKVKMYPDENDRDTYYKADYYILYDMLHKF